MFKDHAVIYVKAGRGGDGCIAFRREKYIPKGGPAGGNGGVGGSVYLEACGQESTLLSLVRNPHVRARPGAHGQGKGMDGAQGDDVVVKVPVGTLVFDREKNTLLRDLEHQGDRVRVVRGGHGGHGNRHFKSSTNQAPRYAVPGQVGEERTLRLELKLIADVGLVGLPNAGKSTLISRVSAAAPKVADYPFTTLQPHPGIVELSNFRRFVMMDIPGLIEGAAEGHGLGHRFLRHVERTRVLVHMVDITGGDRGDAVTAYRAIVDELERYSDALAAKPRVTVLSKSDLVADPEEQAAEISKEFGIDVWPISAATGQGLDRLLEAVWREIAAAREGSSEETPG